ncbi:hypothetical protein ABV409_08060 [Flagellimonas sp. DF-77]|uniref:hypothetical protein n=1 Tax=Flagellimonas algarum TaxID=3230298 RepID=UPI003396DF8A
MIRSSLYGVSYFRKELLWVAVILLLTTLRYIPIWGYSTHDTGTLWFDGNDLQSPNRLAALQPLVFLLCFIKHLDYKRNGLIMATLVLVSGWAVSPFVMAMVNDSDLELLTYYPLVSALLLLVVLTLFFVKIRAWWTYAFLVPMLLTLYAMTKTGDSMVLPSLGMLLILLGTALGIIFLGMRAYDRMRLLALYRKSFSASGISRANTWRKSSARLERARSELEEINAAQEGGKAKLGALERLERDLRKQL